MRQPIKSAKQIGLVEQKGGSSASHLDRDSEYDHTSTKLPAPLAFCRVFAGIVGIFAGYLNDKFLI
jgi:hypothetical protein